MHTTPGKWLVVCVKNARGYAKGQPMIGRERTREEATARAAAMSDVYPGSFVAMPDDDFYASIDDESVLEKYLPIQRTAAPHQETRHDSPERTEANRPIPQRPHDYQGQRLAQ